MDMLQSLGINSTTFIQFGLFILTFYFLKNQVFTQFNDAFLQRHEKTKGGEELTVEFAEKTAQLTSQYQDEARKAHQEISTIYQKNRSDALAEYDRVVNLAHAEAQKLIESSRVSVAHAVSGAASSLKGQAGAVSLAITNKLLGK